MAISLGRKFHSFGVAGSLPNVQAYQRLDGKDLKFKSLPAFLDMDLQGDRACSTKTAEFPLEAGPPHHISVPFLTNKKK